jgi:capsular exopolysaccharide synthesis family protein
MSEFFRALERAERERARRNEGTRHASIDGTGRTETAVPPADSVPGSAPEHVRDTVTELPLVTAATAVDEPPVQVFTNVGMGVEASPIVEEPEPAAPPRPAAKPLTVALDKATGVRGTGEVDERLVSLLTPDSFEADQYRVLRHTVEQRRRTAGVAIVAVSSAGPADGKTTTAINLAGALAQDRGARVLLIDCDLRGSAMARRLGLADGRGLVQAIIDPLLTLDDAIRHLPRFNLDVMAAGFETSSPYELLKSPRLGDLFEAARRRYDYVVVDTPPVVPFPDCRVLAKVVDGFLLVVSAHRTPRRLLDDALDVLSKDAVIGLVFNGGAADGARTFHSYYAEDGAAPPEATWRSSAKRAWARVGGA